MDKASKKKQELGKPESKADIEEKKGAEGVVSDANKPTTDAPKQESVKDVEPVAQMPAVDTTKQECVNEIYSLRHKFLLLGLTGRTGSGCTTVSKVLQTPTDKFDRLKSEHTEFSSKRIDNDVRKNRIIYNYLKQHWHPFEVIKASDVIIYYALKEEFDDFCKSIFGKPADEKRLKSPKVPKKEGDTEEAEENPLQSLEKRYNELHEIVKKCDAFIEKDYIDASSATAQAKIEKYRKLIFQDIPEFRELLQKEVARTSVRRLGSKMQEWGNNIRFGNSILHTTVRHKDSPSCLARKINRFIKMFRALNKKTGNDTLIVIDALRNPYEILYFRERYSAFYTISVSTDEKTRHDKLYEKGFTKEEIKDIDKGEEEKKKVKDSFLKIDIDRCIQLSDIHLTHDGSDYTNNRKLVNQIFTYLALIYHPGLVPPSKYERIMQIAYTARLNSGCLSRQVGAVVTNDKFSVMSVGWNTVAEGQVPCSLRSLDDLYNKEDKDAYSNFEKRHEDFTKAVDELHSKYQPYMKGEHGLPCYYCFKDIHTSSKKKQTGNQVHTRSLHAEENAFLQLAKYGNSQGVKGGILFTTASCCELCAKKAYQLGIKEIYYIDSYPGISEEHILNCGDEDKRPVMKLFSGAVGRAYMSLYDQFMPLKDEQESLSDVDVKKVVKSSFAEENTQKSENGTDSND